MEEDEILQKIVQEISQNHHKIIDDWCKAYLAHIYREGEKINPGCFILNEQVQLENKHGIFSKKYWFSRVEGIDENGVPF